MEIQHTTVTQIDKIIETYKRTEGTDIVYVCTTDLIKLIFLTIYFIEIHLIRNLVINILV